MKRIWIILIISMFIISILPGIVGENETVEYTFKAKRFIENRDVIPIYTAHGLEKAPGGKGKPSGPPPGKNKPPSVTITNPIDGATVSGIVIITVEVNDKEDEEDPTPVIEIDGELVAEAFTYPWNTDLEEDGPHTITSTATDSGGKTGSDSITVIKGSGSNPIDKYALVIGISDYEGSGNDLKYCDDDAVDWKDFLEGEGYTVTMLKDNQATADNIIAAVDDLLADEDGNDYVVFTYSGHGTKFTGYGSCIVTHDLTYITHGWFEQKFDSSDSSHIYFAFDACVIGDFKGLVENNRVGAFASNRRYSYDGDATMQNGVFTYYQMDGWDNQNFENFEDDCNYAVQKMKSWAKANYVRVDPFLQDMYVGSMMP